MDEKIFAEAVVELHTLLDLLRWSVSQFNAAPLFYGHGNDNSWDEALHLILATLNLSPDNPQEIYSARLTVRERGLIVERVMQRIKERIPAAYICQKSWFCGLPFYVDQRVLVPRSPIAELIRNRFAGHLTFEPRRILDMCTGSGCIAIACAYTYPDAEVDAVDLSSDALAVAEYNIQEHGLEDRVIPIRSDLFDSLLQDEYDLIIANPPYVSDSAMAELYPEYAHEPNLGLSGGRDGLRLVLRILALSADYLSSRGMLICEVGDSRIYLEKTYPGLLFSWLPLARGGEGIFLLTRAQLLELQSHLASTLGCHGRLAK